jgi:hypothetical protein
METLQCVTIGFVQRIFDSSISLSEFNEKIGKKIRRPQLSEQKTRCSSSSGFLARTQRVETTYTVKPRAMLRRRLPSVRMSTTNCQTRLRSFVVVVVVVVAVSSDRHVEETRMNITRYSQQVSRWCLFAMQRTPDC